MSSNQITLAAVAGAHGVGGEVRLKLFAEGLDSLKRQQTLFAGDRPLTLKSIRPGSAGAIARFAEIADRAAAEALRGSLLSVPRAALPPLEEGEYYHADLIGLPCVTDAERPLGTAVAVENFGAGDIVEIERPDGSRFMVPIAKAVRIEADRLVVDEAFAQ
ncbi:ribosome maturation factor RimM [Sphingosinicella sp.]|uniref:ribosome maturation factor RimM n=1 Tax=Sphingosinicella sp. TaxID=1917971 RepID=UPI0040380E5E